MHMCNLNSCPYTPNSLPLVLMFPGWRKSDSWAKEGRNRASEGSSCCWWRYIWGFQSWRFLSFCIVFWCWILIFIHFDCSHRNKVLNFDVFPHTACACRVSWRGGHSEWYSRSSAVCQIQGFEVSSDFSMGSKGAQSSYIMPALNWFWCVELYRVQADWTE